MAFDPDYASCSYTHVWLRVMDEKLDLDEISTALGVPYSRCIRAGELKSARLNKHYTHTGWFLESAGQVESRDVRDHLAWLLDQIGSKGTELRAFRDRGYLADICFRWDSAWGHGGPTFDPVQLVQLGSLGLEVWFDIYFDSEEPEA